MASTYYISPTGDNGNDGSESTPWETMAYAYTNSSEGDTIYCQAGTHTWVDQIFTTGRTIQGAGKTLTFFDAGGPSATFDPTAQWYCTNMVINDITFQNNGRQVNSSGSVVYALFAKTATGDIGVFNRCIFKDMVLADSPSTSINAAGGIIGCAYNNGLIVTVELNSCIFYDNTIASGYSTGTVFAGRKYSSINNNLYVTANKCTFHFNGTGGTGINFICYQVTESTFNNCILLNETGLIVNSGVYDGDVYYNNCDLVSITDGVFATRSDCITDDPEFVDGANGDYRLRQDSPNLDLAKAG